MVVTKGTGLQTPPRLCVVPVILPAAQTVVATGPRTPAAGRLAALTEPRGGVAVMTGEDRNKGSCCWTCIWILKKRVSEWTLYSVGALTPLSSSPHSSAHGRTGQVYRSHTLHCVVPHTHTALVTSLARHLLSISVVTSRTLLKTGVVWQTKEKWINSGFHKFMD